MASIESGWDALHFEESSKSSFLEMHLPFSSRLQSMKSAMCLQFLAERLECAMNKAIKKGYEIGIITSLAMRENG